MISSCRQTSRITITYCKIPISATLSLSEVQGASAYARTPLESRSRIIATCLQARLTFHPWRRYLCKLKKSYQAVTRPIFRSFCRTSLVHREPNMNLGSKTHLPQRVSITKTLTWQSRNERRHKWPVSRSNAGPNSRPSHSKRGAAPCLNRHHRQRRILTRLKAINLYRRK